MRRLPWLAFAAALSSPAVSLGGVVVVDSLGAPPAYPTIQAAVDSANEGDTVLVKSGTYAQFVIHAKSLTVVGDAGATVSIQSVGSVEAVKVEALAANQHVVLRNLKIAHSGVDAGLVLDQCQGAVLAEDVSVSMGTAPDPVAGAAVRTSKLVASRCTFQGTDLSSGAGVLLESGSLAAYHCAVTGGKAAILVQAVPAPPPEKGGPGISIDAGSALFSMGSSWTGGQGGDVYCNLLYGGCWYGGPGGDAIVLAQGGVLVQLDSTVTAGLGGKGYWTYDGGMGLTVLDWGGLIVPLAGSARSFQVTSPARSGQDVTVTFGGIVGDQVLMLLAMAPASIPMVGFHGVLGVGVPALAIPAGALNSANLSFPVTLPVIPGGAAAASLVVQAAFTDTTGATFLADPTAIVVLDPAY